MKLCQSGRISKEEALGLYQSGSLHELGLMADEITARKHPGKVRTYVVERNINYTNICRSRCSFCAFSVSPAEKRGYTLSYEQIREKISELNDLGGTQILLQGGLNPHLAFSWYEELLQRLKQDFPRLHIHGFSPPEIVFWAEHFDMAVAKVLERLHHSGLDSIPGGGAEILVDRVRRLISPGKCSSGDWLAVMRQAHELGLGTTATMMFGHLESLEERLEHLERLRDLQDESLSRRRTKTSSGYFTAFTCWPFQACHTRLGSRLVNDITSGANRRENQILPAGAFEQLKMTALARIFLDNIENIQASWVTQGGDIAQLSLLMGCNDMGSVMMEENVVSAAGTAFKLTRERLKELINSAGFQPVQRDYYYNHLP